MLLILFDPYEFVDITADAACLRQIVALHVIGYLTGAGEYPHIVCALTYYESVLVVLIYGDDIIPCGERAKE